MKAKRIIIIGASSGIGKEMALIYAKKGCTLGITGRRKDLLEELKNQFPGQISISVFDVMGSNNQVEIKQLIEKLGGLDLLIYNSGYGDISRNLDWQIENATTRTNVNGFVEITVSAFNFFIQKGEGQIALTSSVAGIRGNSWAPAYSASKAFMSNYAEGLNIKATKMKKKVIITDIRPGFVNTKMAKGNGQFWVSTPEKAARQMVMGIERKKRVVYITRRWRLVAWILRNLPYFLYKRLA